MKFTVVTYNQNVLKSLTKQNEFKSIYRNTHPFFNEIQEIFCLSVGQEEDNCNAAAVYVIKC